MSSLRAHESPLGEADPFGYAADTRPSASEGRWRRGIGEHCLIVALGIAADGQKHVLG